jgi:hypothetical protein
MLNFIQSNWHRQYPFRKGHGALDVYNNSMPIDLIVALRITHTTTTNIHISKVVTNNGYVSVLFSAGETPVGAANGMISSSNQSLLIINFNGGIIGNVTIGNIDSTKPVETFLFNANNGLIEPSVVTILAAPNIKKLSIKGNDVKGVVTLSSKTVAINTNSTIDLSAIDPTSVFSRNDKSAKNLTCDNPTIAGINSVIPNTAGNIDIFGISPLAVTKETIDGVTHIKLSTPELGLDKLCKQLNLPPTNASSTSYQPIETITKPEWAATPEDGLALENTWPQYKQHE